MEETPCLQDFYKNYDEDGRLATRYGSVEFLTTMRYLERYLKPGDRVLEVGAGTGRYSHALARRGYDVQAVELLEHNLEILRRNTEPGETLAAVQGNAMDLSAFPDGGFDMTLLLGPLYHLYSDAAFSLYLDYHFATCERADFVGVTSHALDIFRKQ